MIRSRSGSASTSRTRRTAPSATGTTGTSSSVHAAAGKSPGAGSAPSIGSAGSTPVSAPPREMPVEVPTPTVPPSTTVSAHMATSGSRASWRRVSTIPPTIPGARESNSAAWAGTEASSSTTTTAMPAPSRPLSASSTARATSPYGAGSSSSTRTPGTVSVGSRRSDHSRPMSPPVTATSRPETTAEVTTGVLSALRPIPARTASPTA